jgi:pimeloyl-ACP methyl ester carboxylesterase
MHTELISIPTATHPLDAAYYTPDGPRKGAVMYCHGNQMNVYVCAARFLAPHITALGYDFMPFNRRGHDSVSTYDSRDCVGGAYQTVAEGIEDNEIAAKYLADKGYRNPIVIGHSNGGVLASEHVARHPETRALILLSAHAGGNRMTNPHAARNFSLAGDTTALSKEAEALIAAGKPRQLMLIPAVVGNLGAHVSRPAFQCAGSRRECQANKMPGIIHPRRSRTEGKLPGGALPRKLRRPVRSRDRA